MIRAAIICAVLSLFCLSFVPNSAAHEIRPAFLKITETTPENFMVAWKQPIVEGKRLKITPIFPKVCAASAPDQTLTGGTVTERYFVACPLTSGTLTLEGLERTLTDVFVDIEYLSGQRRTALLKPSSLSLDLGGPPESPASQYFGIGLEHILLGWDHLLFVIGLTLLVARRKIIGVATAFTLAHSLTLGLAAFGLLNVPTRPVEILIAASIVFLALEIIRKHRDPARAAKTLTRRRPYLIGFGIGLIHGCGFASALADIGLPKGTELLALLLFNIGVEVGQFMVIAALIGGLAVLYKFKPTMTRAVEITASYAIAAIAMFWVLTRGGAYFV